MTQKEIIAQKHSEIIKQIAKAEGFDYVGISKAEKLEDDSRKLENWLNAGMHGEMTYMERNFEMRTDPRVLVPGAKSVISLLYNYYTDQKPEDETAPLPARLLSSFGTRWVISSGSLPTSFI